MKNPLRGLFAPRDLSEGEATSLMMGDMLPGRSVSVTGRSALASTAVLACLIVRAETFAALPVHVYRNVPDGRKHIADDPVELLAGGYANPLQSASEFWRWEQLTEDIWGNAYVRVEWRGGTPIALWPMVSAQGALPMRLSTKGVAVYEYSGDQVTPAGEYTGRDILHFKGPLMREGWYGTSLVQLAADSIGLSIASERFFSRLLSNGSHFPGYLQTDNSLQQTDIDKLRSQFEDKHKGVANAGKVPIFDRGLKWLTNPMTMRDAQLSEQNLWNLQQICRVFRVPPPLVQDYSNSTYTNAAESGRWFAQHTILPIAVNTEKTVGRIFEQTGKRDRYVKFELDGLLRGDPLARAQANQIAVLTGWKTRNEARKDEDMNPLEGLDKPILPLNEGVVEDDGTVSVPNTPAAPPTASLAPVLAHALERIRDRRAKDGDTDRTVEFAEMVLAPVAEAYELAGAVCPVTVPELMTGGADA